MKGKEITRTKLFASFIADYPRQQSYSVNGTLEQLFITKLRRVSKIVSREGSDMDLFHTNIRFSSKAEEVFSCNFETKRHLNTAEIILEKAGPGTGSRKYRM